jgi:phage regulator Rha-like protein
MNELVNLEKAKMMSSKRIAEKTGKEHSNVLRDIRNMIDELKKDDSNLNDDFLEVKDARNYTYEILLNERLSLCLASGYSITLRMMIIDEWAILKQPKELTRKELALMVVKAEEEKEQLLLQVDNLSTALDSLVEWVSIIKICTKNKIKETVFDWRYLKKKSAEMGYSIKKAQSARYGFQNLYHINVFKACYPQFNYEMLN